MLVISRRAVGCRNTYSEQAQVNTQLRPVMHQVIHAEYTDNLFLGQFKMHLIPVCHCPFRLKNLIFCSCKVMQCFRKKRIEIVKERFPRCYFPGFKIFKIQPV